MPGKVVWIAAVPAVVAALWLLQRMTLPPMIRDDAVFVQAGAPGEAAAEGRRAPLRAFVEAVSRAAPRPVSPAHGRVPARDRIAGMRGDWTTVFAP